jgi:acetyl esterase/lipase
MQKTILFLLAITMNTTIQAQQVLPLYGDGPIPNARPGRDEETSEVGKDPNRISVNKVSRPTLTIFLPAKDSVSSSAAINSASATRTAVIVCPGGGYTHLAIAHEGYELARHLSEMGIVAFVLKYRLPSDTTMIDKEIGPLQDAQRAIQLVRQNAAVWGIDPGRIGIMGFSAGGHLASTAGTHFTKAVIDNPAHTTLRPDFMILIYPVISFADSIGHRGCRDNLIGVNPPQEKIIEYSNELQVTPQTPPTFLVHAEDDKTVDVRNALFFYEALQRNGVLAELHIYPQGGHGYGLHNPTTKDEWFGRLKNWLDSNGWLQR